MKNNKEHYLNKNNTMVTVKRLFISLIVLLGCTAGAWAIEQDSDGYYLIGSVQDWKDFAELVNTGTVPAANAKMVRDVDLGDDQTRIGSTSDSNTAQHYKGIFDGQGHKLTIAYLETGGSNLCAPFNKLDGATIKNLHIKGTINTAGIHGAGIASDARGTTLIQNVWSEVDVTSTHSGWDECSGIVGCMKAGNLTITDCLFSGTVTANSSHNGGFIGYKDSGTSSISNCLSTGTFAYGSSQDFSNGATVSNSYYTQFVGSASGLTLVTDTQLANGTIATALQAERSEEIWVQDPELGIPMLKIFVTPAVDYFLIGSLQDWKDFAELVETEPTTNGKLIADVDLGEDQTMVGSMESPYRGIFDGQGYTLTVNYDMNLTTSAVAPFNVVGDAVIQKLHVAGSIKQQYCAAGGVVGSIMGNVTIKECWVSAYMYVQGYGNLQGTIGGIASCCDNSNASNCSILIEDCVFSGEMATGYHCGSIMSHVNGGYGNSAVIKNCLAIGSYVSPIETTGTFIRVGVQGDPYTIDNCYYKTSWGYVQGTQATETELSDGTTAAALGDAWAQDPGTGNPLPKVFTTMRQDEDGYYLIASVTDWKRFADIVNSGMDPAANAKMIADVDLGDDQTMIGSGSINASDGAGNVVFKGTFDGQGHTLTVNYNNSETFVAPFRFIFGATIKNIHVKGSVTGSGKWLGGIVASVVGRNIYSYLEKCYSSVSVTSTNSPSDNTEHIGGIVSQHAWESKLSLTDCIFDGTLKRKSANKTMSGLVGCSDGVLDINNCISLGTLMDESDNPNRVATLAYPWIHGSLNAVNTYYKNDFGTLQGTQATDGEISDGTTAAALQADRDEDIWVQDPVLGYPMLKIFANIQDEDGNYLIGSVQDWKRFADIVKTTPTANAKMVADVDLGNDQTRIGDVVGDGSGVKFGGIFDGQGHTLTVAYSITGHNMCAPFTKTNGATIKNLHVAGTMRTEFCHLAGIIADAYGTNTIENVWVSADLTSANNYNTGGILDLCGAIVGCKKNGNLTISDCLFTGTITTINNSIWNGSILGYIDGGDQASATITNCLSVGTFNYTEHETNIPNRGTISNSYVYQFPTTIPAEMQVTDDDISDGTTAAALQAGRADEIWVQDSELGIPMLKIFANEETEQPSEALNGVFTINASGEKVSFAKGNLQKIGSTYQFAEHQYDYFGTNQSDTHRDMYAFLAYSNPDNGESWSMLSRDEWVYLFATRSVTNTLSDGARYTMATIGDTYKGLIIFPDYYEHPEGTGFIAGVFNSNSNYTAQVSLEGWAMMEAAGCVFLPAAGYRSYNGTWYGVGEEIGYMSCTEHPKYISTYFTPYITPDGVYVDETSNKQTWTSIRLVLRKQPITYTVPASGVGTFSSEVNIHLPEGLNAHYCKTYYAERSAISVVNISSGVVPANTGVLLSGTPGETFNLYPTPETADELEGNALVSVTKPTHISATKGDYTNFMMKGGKFIRIEAASYTVKMPANRAYLPLLTEAISGSNAKEIMLYWDDEEATGIERMRNVENEIMRKGNIYNLNGQKLSAPQKGINIINGRKVIVK